MPKQINRNQDFTFSIKKSLGVLSTAQTGWTKEVNLVEWNGNPAKLDIRDWDPDHEHMGRGITLHKPETLELLEILLRSFGKDLARAKASGKQEHEAEDNVASAQESPVEETAEEPAEEPFEAAETAETDDPW